MRVLIIKTSSMGDILHTLPSLTDALYKIPDISFDWIIEEAFMEIPSWHIAVNLIIPISIRHRCTIHFFTHIKIAVKKIRNIIHTQNYDAVIDAQGLIKSAALTAATTYNNIKHGMDWHTAREPLASLFYNYCHHVKKYQHAVERTRELFAKSLGYTKPKTQGNYAITKHILQYSYALKDISSSYIMFLHATTRTSKLWPESHWRDLIKLIQLHYHHMYNIKLPWGTEYERQQAERLALGFDNVEVLPKLSLLHIAQYLVKSRIIVSVDTGLSHLAAALNRPNITIFGPTNPVLIGGYGKNQYQVISLNKRMKAVTASYIFALLQNYFLLS